MDKIKGWLKARLKIALLKGVDDLSRLQPVLADQIRKRLNPDQKAEQLVSWVQDELRDLIGKIHGSNFLNSLLLGAVKSALLKEVDGLSKYQDDIADYMRRHIDADQKSTLVIEYLQEYLRAQIEKHFE